MAWQGTIYAPIFERLEAELERARKHDPLVRARAALDNLPIENADTRLAEQQKFLARLLEGSADH